MKICWQAPWSQSSTIFTSFSKNVAKIRQSVATWSDEDKAIASEATILGKPLSFGEHLYEDLQKLYVDT